MPSNGDLSRLFSQMAAVLELLDENRFKVIAYQKAARVIGEMTVDLSTFTEISQLTAIEGVGKGLAEKILEYFRTGKVAEIEKALAAVPPGVLLLLNIPGLGPKTAAMLWKQAGVESIADLKKKIADGSLVNLPRMGEKTVEKIAKSLAFVESSGGRLFLGDATEVAARFIAQLRKIHGVVRCDFAGSLRRGRETIGDIDLLASCQDPEKQAEPIGRAFRELDSVVQVIAAGPTKASVRTDSGMQVDLRIVADDRYGAALMYFTGSKAHNIVMRERAIKRGLRLNEYGLWRGETDKGNPVAAETEKEIYKALDLPYIEPELREDRGEISAAEGDWLVFAKSAEQKGACPPPTSKLPKLIELADIRAELHAHTTASDGLWSIEQLAAAAKARGFHTVAVTDHSVSSTIANGLDATRLEKHIEAIHAAGAKVKGITILAGSEVDILADGKLDYPDSLLKELDIVVASPHAALTQDPDKATARLLRALENPRVHILGHPTGRLINRREGLSPRMDELFEAAAQRGVAMEINANQWRLDLRDTHARAAVEAGVMLAINTDAHGPADLDQLPYGILTARRAWVEPKHVVNCLPAAELKKWLKK